MRLIDGSMFRIPRIGVYTAKGVNMEKEGVKPDVLVDDHPDQLAKGIDAQLDKAVEVLQAEVVAWKKKDHSSVVGKPGGSGSFYAHDLPRPLRHRLCHPPSKGELLVVAGWYELAWFVPAG